MTPGQLEELRKDINEIDSELMTLLAKRRRISHLVAELKIKLKKPIRDLYREEKLLAELVEYGQSLGLDPSYVHSVYHVILVDSVLSQQIVMQQNMNPSTQEPIYRVAFLGGVGSYSFLAMNQYFNRRSGQRNEVSCESFNQIFQEVEQGRCEYAVLPIENTSSGGINEVYDLLQQTSLSIVGELTLPIKHCVMGIKDIPVNEITTLITHPQPYHQCSLFLQSYPNIQIEFANSTADAFKVVQARRDPYIAAIGSREGGKFYELCSIQDSIANQQDNFSRFIIVSRKPTQVANQIPAKTTLIMTTDQKAGSLVDVLIILKQHKINMTKLESRPIIGTPWEEMFYLDVEVNVNHSNFLQAFEKLQQLCKFVKVLGCYASDIIN